MTDISIHSCKDVKVTHHMPKNSNYIELTVYHDADGLKGKFPTKSTIALFGLPEEVTDELICVIGSPELRLLRLR